MQRPSHPPQDEERGNVTQLQNPSTPPLSWPLKHQSSYILHLMLSSDSKILCVFITCFLLEHWNVRIFNTFYFLLTTFKTLAKTKTGRIPF